MAKRFLLVVLVCAFALLLVEVVSADPTCPDGYISCPLTDGFDTDIDGWSNYSPTPPTWLALKSDSWFSSCVKVVSSSMASIFCFFLRK